MQTISFLGVAHIHMPGFWRMLLERSDVKVAAVWDDEPARRSHWAKVTGGREAVSVDDAISGVDAVVINGQTDTHAALVAKAAAAKKPMFVEKPLGLNGADAYAMAKQIEAAGVLFQTGYFQRSDPLNRRVKQLIDNGDLGRITKVTAFNCHSGALGDWFKAKPDTPGEDWNWLTSLPRSGVGAFGDLGTHALDILLWWLGDAASVTAQIDTVTNRYGCDESGQGLIRFASGTTGTLTAGWVDVADPVKYLVSGTKGHAANIGGKLFVARDGQPFDLSKPDTDLPAAAPHAFELFFDVLAGKKTDVPLVTASEAAYRSAVIEAMYDGANHNTWVSPKKS